MQHGRWKQGLLAVNAACLAVFGGCVERELVIRSTPSGADVFVNDEPVGRTPVVVAFLWYGEYDITLRKHGYETLSVGIRPPVPWHQWPGIDLVAESIYPGRIVDRHEYAFDLKPFSPPDREELIARSKELRAQADAMPETSPEPRTPWDVAGHALGLDRGR